MFWKLPDNVSSYKNFMVQVKTCWVFYSLGSKWCQDAICHEHWFWCNFMQNLCKYKYLSDLCSLSQIPWIGWKFWYALEMFQIIICFLWCLHFKLLINNENVSLGPFLCSFNKIQNPLFMPYIFVCFRLPRDHCYIQSCYYSGDMPNM